MDCLFFMKKYLNTIDNHKDILIWPNWSTSHILFLQGWLQERSHIMKKKKSKSPKQNNPFPNQDTDSIIGE